jgi:hypothetical protein
MLKLLGLPDIRLYDLRQTAAIILLKQKVSPRSCRNGWQSTIMLTMDVLARFGGDAGGRDRGHGDGR